MKKQAKPKTATKAKKRPTIAQIRKTVNEFLTPLGYSAKTEDLGHGQYMIEPSTRKTGKNRKDFFDGMVLMSWPDGIYEVAEAQAGKKKDELWIYKESKSLRVALKDLVKGNKRKPIKKW